VLIKIYRDLWEYKEASDTVLVYDVTIHCSEQREETRHLLISFRREGPFETSASSIAQPVAEDINEVLSLTPIQGPPIISFILSVILILEKKASGIGLCGECPSV
jgi:hypothetical protein